MAHETCPGGTCELFGLFGILVQGLIGAWCLVILLLLWYFEKPRRSFLTWFGDMSKQLVGAFWGHFMNVFLAMFLGNMLNESADNNQCVWYLVGFLSDIILVTFLCWIMTTLLRPLIKFRLGFDIGDYDGAGSGSGFIEIGAEDARPRNGSHFLMWFGQTGLWVLIMTVVKLVVSIGVYFSQELLYTGVALLFRVGGLCHHQRAQLVTSVIIIPVIGDAFQFVMQDSFLKNRNRPHERSEVDPVEKFKYQPVADDAGTHSGHLLSWIPTATKVSLLSVPGATPSTVSPASVASSTPREC